MSIPFEPSPASPLPSGTPESHQPPSSSPQLSLSLTVLLGLIFLACVGFLVWSHVSIPSLDRVRNPESALEIVVNQTLLVRTGLSRMSDVEQHLAELISGSGDELNQGIEWYTELVSRPTTPLPHLYLAVLEAEAGQVDTVRRKVAAWKERGSPFPLFARFLEVAYLGNPGLEVDRDVVQAQLAELVPDGWFYSQLALKIASQTHDADLSTMTHRALEIPVARLMRNARVLAVVEGTGIIGGLAALALLVRRRMKNGNRAFRIAAGMLPPPWSGRHGLAVLVRGGGLAAILLVGVSLADLDKIFLPLLIPIAIHVPLLYLAYRYLLVPYGLTMPQVIGLHVVPEGKRSLVLVSLVLIGLGMMGSWGIGWVAQEGHYSLHWTDWFDDLLIRMDWGPLLFSLTGYIILAPLMEELVFRGIFFSTLRRRFGPGMSMVLSAAVFAAAHGYGWIGALSIFWSGLLWAWAYERTGSLLPGIVAHAFNNLLVCLAMLLLIRPG